MVARISEISPARVCVALAVGALCALSAGAADPPPLEERIKRIEEGLVSPLRLEGEPTVRRSLRSVMNESGVPAAALAIVDDCAVVWSGGWGALEEGTAPVTGKTPFQVGSVSKTVTATVAMLMIAEGKLGLDDRVDDRLHSWRLPENDLTRLTPVLVRHLLTSSAGLTRTAFGLDRGAPLPSIPELLRGEAGGPTVVVEEVPGRRAVPSNAGYLLLQHVLEEVAGLPLTSLAHRRLFDKLAMRDSAFEPVDEAFLARAAGGHRGDGTAIEGKAPLVPAAPGGLWSSAEDLGRLLAALMASWQGRDERLLPRSATRQMLSPQLGDMGLGVHLRGEGEATSFQQAGGGIGSQSRLVAYPELCRGAAVVANSDRAGRLIAETLAAVGSEYGWPELPLRVSRTRPPAKALQRFAGRYEYDASPGAVMVFSVEDDTLVASSGEGRPFPIVAVSEGIFVVPDGATEMRFHAREDGPTTGVTIGTAGLYGYHLSRVD